MTKEVFFTCEYYGERFKSKAKCLKHEEREKIKNKVNKMFQNGKTLKEINNELNFQGTKIPEYLENVTKDSCFSIPFQQGCDRPAYQVKQITVTGGLVVDGYGGYYGYYDEVCDIRSKLFKDSRPAEELYVFSED